MTCQATDVKGDSLSGLVFWTSVHSAGVHKVCSWLTAEHYGASTVLPGFLHIYANTFYQHYIIFTWIEGGWRLSSSRSSVPEGKAVLRSPQSLMCPGRLTAKINAANILHLCNVSMTETELYEWHHFICMVYIKIHQIKMTDVCDKEDPITVKFLIKLHKHHEKRHNLQLYFCDHFRPWPCSQSALWMPQAGPVAGLISTES